MFSYQRFLTTFRSRTQTSSDCFYEGNYSPTRWSHWFFLCVIGTRWATLIWKRTWNRCLIQKLFGRQQSIFYFAKYLNLHIFYESKMAHGFRLYFFLQFDRLLKFIGEKIMGFFCKLVRVKNREFWRRITFFARFGLPSLCVCVLKYLSP